MSLSLHFDFCFGPAARRGRRPRPRPFQVRGDRHTLPAFRVVRITSEFRVNIRALGKQPTQHRLSRARASLAAPTEKRIRPVPAELTRNSGTGNRMECHGHGLSSKYGSLTFWIASGRVDRFGISSSIGKVDGTEFELKLAIVKLPVTRNLTRELWPGPRVHGSVPVARPGDAGLARGCGPCPWPATAPATEQRPLADRWPQIPVSISRRDRAID